MRPPWQAKESRAARLVRIQEKIATGMDGNQLDKVQGHGHVVNKRSRFVLRNQGSIARKTSCCDAGSQHSLG